MVPWTCILKSGVVIYLCHLIHELPSKHCSLENTGLASTSTSFATGLLIILELFLIKHKLQFFDFSTNQKYQIFVGVGYDLEC